MKVYVVLFYVSFEGCYSDENCKVFKDIEKVKEYVDELNIRLAARDGREVKDLLDYYDYEEMDLV